MPIPFILGGLAIGAGLLGVGKALDAKDKNDRAERMNRFAERTVEEAKEALEQKRKICEKSLKNLGQSKLDSMHTGIKPFVESFKKIHNVDLRNSAGLDELGKLNITQEDLQEMEQISDLSTEIISGSVGGLAAGAATALGAYGAAGALGIASTGAAISGLTGVAASNATLAFLGGGSLAAGGLGMTAGAFVLGGLVAGPALAVMGFVMGAKAEENLDNARSNRAEAEKIVEQCETAGAMCVSIKERCDLIAKHLKNLNDQLGIMTAQMSEIVAKHTKKSFADYNSFNEKEKGVVAATAALAKSVKSILDVPVLNEQGELTNESAKLIENFGG